MGISIREITNYLESLAPINSQESYDNSGLILGDYNQVVDAALLSLDCIEATVEEAIRLNIKLIITHHPLIFKPIKQLNGSNATERMIIQAIKNDIALYAIHTNLDNYVFGVNFELGNRLGLTNLRVLRPKTGVLCKLICYVPVSHAESVRNAMFDAGAGNIGNYSECSFESAGQGTFTPGSEANPFMGSATERTTVTENKLEVLVSKHKISAVLKAMKSAHPYEEVAYDLIELMNSNQYEGSGMLGEFEEGMLENDLLLHIKSVFNAQGIRHTRLMNKPVTKIAFCGGSGSFLLKDAISAGADVFITGDFKYHDFFEAEGKIVVIDIGHYESEQFTTNLIAAQLMKKFPKFAVRLTEVNTNPINYF